MPGGQIHFINPFFQSDALILDDDSSLTLFKTSYRRHRNFAKQKFRLESEGLKEISPTTNVKLSFKVKKYADLLLDATLCVQIPDIWSPIQYPIPETSNQWAPYEFRWIKNIGCHMIKSVEVICGGQVIQKISGEYMAAHVERDLSAAKRKIFDEMTGNVPELYNPAYANGKHGVYPSAYYTPTTGGAEPSIRGRILYIPLHLWFSEHKKRALPLCALRDAEIFINITLRPIYELIQVRDITDKVNDYPYIQPNMGDELFQIYRFLQTPPSPMLTTDSYANQRLFWDLDPHLICNYVFLDETERIQFTKMEHNDLISVITEYRLPNQIGTSVFKLPTTGMVSSWMIRMQRSDVFMRNEWDNYTNWPYETLPSNINPPSATDANTDNGLGPGRDPNMQDTNIFITGAYNADNYPHIMETMAIKMDGEYREMRMTRGVYQYIERYNQTIGSGGICNGLYCYNFGLDTASQTPQPNGYLNVSKFKRVELEFSLYTPPFNPANAVPREICDATGVVIGTVKDNWRLYEYTYDIVVFEERYNLLTIKNGLCSFAFA